MTISSTTRINGPYISGTALPVTFKVFTAADLQVIRLNTSTGTETTLVLNSDYTVTLNGDQNTNPGGTVTLVVAASATSTVTITSDIANLQPTDLTNQGGFYPEVITDSLDRATIQIQQIADIGDRTLKIPISDGTLNMELPTKTERANSFLSFDANGLPSVVTAGSSGAPATITRQVFSGTGSQTVFTLASDPGAVGNSAQVYIGGVYQQRSTYTIAGTTLTFSAAPVAGTNNIEFVNFLTSTIGTTSADLVTYTPSGTGAVARSAASKFGDVVSVKDFGAVGDGVTDDTAAIIAADAAAAARKCDLYFPSGTYYVGGRTSAIAPTTSWRGESHWYNQFALPNFEPPAVGTLIDAGSANLDTLSANFFAREIAGINFKGTGTGSHVNVLSGSRMFRIFNCAMHGKDHAIKVSGAVAYILRFSRIFAARQASDAIFLDFGSGSYNDIEIRDSWILRPDGRGIFATQTSGGCTLLSIVGNDITDGTGDNAAISISGVAGLRIVGNDIEGWGAIYTNPSTLTGKTGYNTNARCIQVSATSALIEGNVTYGCGATFPPIRLLTCANVRIGPHRILKDLSTHGFAFGIDAASSNVTIEPQQTDFAATTSIAVGALRISDRSTGNLSTNANQTLSGDTTVTGTIAVNTAVRYPSTVPQVASASTITIPDAPLVEITGTTNVSFITGMSRRIVTLLFTDILTMQDDPPSGGNLRLSGNFTTTATSTLTLMSTGVGGSWREIARSVN